MEKSKRIHEGRNVKRFREMLGIKQEGLAFELGEEWTQKKVSQLEAKESIEEDILEQVAKILNVSPEAIRNFNEESAFNIISNTFTNNENATGVNYNCDLTFNPLEKLLESYEENKKIQEENKQLYERLLQSEREKIVYLEKITGIDTK